MNPFDPYQTGLVVRWLKPCFPTVDEYVLSLAVMNVTRRSEPPTMRDELLEGVSEAIRVYEKYLKGTATP